MSGIIANDVQLPISAMDTLLGILKYECNELTEGLIAILGVLAPVRHVFEESFLSESSVHMFGGISFSWQLLTVLSFRFQYLCSGGGIRKGIVNMRHAANVGTAPAT